MTVQVDLQPFATRELDKTKLAEHLHGLVVENRHMLAVDRPDVVRLYGTQASAYNAVTTAASEMRRSGGAHGTFAVRMRGAIVGVATARQLTLTRTVRRRLWFDGQETIAEGPLLSLWLAATMRAGEERNLLGAILRVGAATLQTSTGLSGFPLVLVNPQFDYLIHVLRQPTNGFGGFNTLGQPENWQHIDGIPGLRALYVGMRQVHTLGQR